MTTTALMPQSRQRYYNNDGTPCVGGFLYTYDAGTTNPRVTYADAAGTVPNTNPIVLDAHGEATIYWSGAYKVDLRQADGTQVTGYPVDNLNTDPAGVWSFLATVLSTLAATTGAGLIGWISSAAQAVARTVKDKLSERVSVFDFMTAAQIADVQARTLGQDVTAAMQAARDYIATTRKKLIFPPGAYKYSVSPNWAIHHATIEFEGDVTLHYTGAGNAVIIDASAADAVTFTAGLLYGLKFGWGNRPTIEGAATSGHGMFVQAAHHCKIGGRVRGCGTASDGLRVQFAVCSEFDVHVSVNEDGWNAGAKPANGYFLTRRNAAETTSYCTFVNPVVEGPNIGIYLNATLGNTFLGGTAEACTQYGVYGYNSAAQDKFYGMDFEANGSADVYDQGGTSLLFKDCDTALQLTIQGKYTQVVGGRHKKILVDLPAVNASVRDVVYNRFNDGTTFTDAGTGTLLDNIRNGGGNVSYLTGSTAVNAVTIANNSLGVTVIPVTGARFGDFVQVAFDGGSLGAMIVWGVVSAVNQVTAYTFNNTGAGVNVAAGNWRATVSRR